MKRICSLFTLIFISLLLFSLAGNAKSSIRVLVVTGGHSYNKPSFNAMLDALGKNITCEVTEFPAAWEWFQPANRAKYDLLVFYHMWQKSTTEQEEQLSACIRDGKPVVVLHHSICAFDDWPEYWKIIGGKYFHKPTVLDGKEYAACSYIHDIHFRARVLDKHNPVTKGIRDFDLFDETYKGYYTDPAAVPILATDEPSSNRLIGWTKQYGKSRIVTLQSGHNTPTYENPAFRKLLRQAIVWTYAGIKESGK